MRTMVLSEGDEELLKTVIDTYIGNNEYLINLSRDVHAGIEPDIDAEDVLAIDDIPDVEEMTISVRMFASRNKLLTSNASSRMRLN